jgi:hypothetical protein
MPISLSYFFQALSDRQKTNQSSVYKQVLLTSVVLFASISMSILLTPEGKKLSYHFIEEGGFNTVVTAFFLAAASTLMFATHMSESASGLKSSWIWIVQSVGFAFLSVDEMFQLHEQIGLYFDTFVSSGPFINWNDLLGAVYGFMAIITALIILPKILPIRSLPELLAMAFLFFMAHMLTDLMVDHSSDFTHIAEESLKLFSAGFLALAGYSALKWSLNRNRTGPSSSL